MPPNCECFVTEQYMLSDISVYGIQIPTSSGNDIKLSIYMYVNQQTHRDRDKMLTI